MATTSSPLKPTDLRIGRRRSHVERVVRFVLLAAAAFTVLISTLIVAVLFTEAAQFLLRVDLSSLWADGWYPRRGDFDILTLLIGTLLVTAIAMLIAAPLGLGAALYLSEYASPRARRTLKPILEILAGIPSVVLGYFALTLITPQVVQRMWPDANPLNIAAAGIGVGILIVPIVASISEDALAAVPAPLRDASIGLGARKISTTVRVVVPAAVSGIVASFIIAFSRALGETMVVAIAMGASGGALRTWDITQNGQTMTAAMISLVTGSDNVKGDTEAFQSLFFLGLVLFLLTFALNVLGERFVRRVRHRY
ncbi:MAG: phosphate ABC transporter permease subunit PstC [Acidimicrobiia bacterium]|nr:phosphate ABC transporter permease subunit PstC [Acidimicrobiia bacterium]